MPKVLRLILLRWQCWCTGKKLGDSSDQLRNAEPIVH